MFGVGSKLYVNQGISSTNTIQYYNGTSWEELLTFGNTSEFEFNSYQGFTEFDKTLYVYYNTRVLKIDIETNEFQIFENLPNTYSNYGLIALEDEFIMGTRGGILGTKDFVNFHPLDAGSLLTPETSQCYSASGCTTDHRSGFYKGELFYTVDGRLLVSKDNGRKYENLRTDLHLDQFYLSSNKIFSSASYLGRQLSIANSLEAIPSSFQKTRLSNFEDVTIVRPIINHKGFFFAAGFSLVPEISEFNTYGFFRSTDGVNWERKFEGIPTDNDLFDTKLITHKGNLYATTRSDNLQDKFLYRSTDLGETWELVNIPVSGITNIYSTSSRLFILNGNSVLYASEDEGADWDSKGFLEVNGLIEYGNTLLALTASVKNLRVLTNSDAIHISTDNGDTWTELIKAPTIEGTSESTNISQFEVIGDNLVIDSSPYGFYYLPLSELGIEKLTPTVDQVTPTTLSTGDTLTIVGDNFTNNSQSLNEVIFGDVHGDIIEATQTKLRVVIPKRLEGTFRPVVKSRNVATTSTTQVTLISTSPKITSLSPQVVSVNDELKINGQLFDPNIANNTVTIGGINVPVTSASTTQIIVQIPEELRSSSPQPLVLITGGEETPADSPLTFKAPQLISVSSTEALVGEVMNVVVGGLSSTDSLNKTYLNNTAIEPISINNDTLRFTIPNLPFGNYDLKVKVNELFSNARSFKVIAPIITSITPSNNLLPKDIITISGENFGATVNSNAVSIKGISLTIIDANATQIRAEVPEVLRGSAPSRLTLASNNAEVSSLNLLSFKPASISNIEPQKAFPNTEVTVIAEDFSSVVSQNELFFANTLVAIQRIDGNTLVAITPEGVKGIVDVRLKVGDQRSNALNFEMLAPVINSFSPLTASKDDILTIRGNNFGENIDNLIVLFGNISAQVIELNSNQTEIKVVVPDGLTNNTPVNITVNYKGAANISATQFRVIDPFISVSSPTNGEEYNISDEVSIQFESNINEPLKIELFKGGAFNQTIIAQILSNNSPFNWRIPNNITSGNDYSVRVSVVSNPSFFNTSNGNFTINNANEVLWGNIEINNNDTSSPNNLEISISALSIIPIETMKIEYFSLRDSSSKKEIISTSPQDSRYLFSIPNSDFDELGIGYRFEAILANGLIDKNIDGWLYEYRNYSNGLDIPYTSYGSSQSNYKIVSTPLELVINRIEEAFGGTDKLGNYGATEDWIMYTYNNNQNNSPNSFDQFQSGIGYWLIAKNRPSSGNLSSGSGKAIEAYDGNAFTISVSQGFNLIGNPYPFPITLQDLQNANPSLSIAELKGYNSGFTTKNRLEIGEGAFIDAATSGTLTFPVNSNNNGRFSANYFQSKAPLDASEWIVNLDLQSGELINHVAGIGMHTQASQGKDLFDQKVMPKFFTYLQATFKGTDITKDIVSTQKEYTWEFEVESTTDYPTITLSWKNDYFGENHNKALVLEDTQSGRVINMAQSNSYTFTNEKRTFKIHFGDKEELDNSLLPTQWNVFEPYPVPFNNRLTIPIALPESGEVLLELYDVQGKQVGSQILEFSKAGYHEIMIQNKTASQLSKGVYLYRVGFKNQWINGKLSKE